MGIGIVGIAIGLVVVIIVFLLFTGRKKGDDHVSDLWVQQDKQKGGRHDL
jgi:hypothetical protein